MRNVRDQTGKQRRGILAVLGGGAAFAFVCSILFVAPVASAGTPSVVIKTPFSGVAYTDTETSFSGVGCPGSGNLTFTAPYFSLKWGRGGAGLEADSNPCSSGVPEYHEVDTWFGANLTTITPATTVTGDQVKFHWVLTYSLLVNTTWLGGGDYAYAYAEVSAGAWVYDVTTGGTTAALTVYDNSTYLDDATGTQQIYVSLYKVSVPLFVKITLLAGDTYELYSYVQSRCVAETDGPAGSLNEALAQVSWPGTGPAGNLKSVSY